MRDLPENNLNYPVLVEIDGGNGSGFYLNFEDSHFYLVTAYHVLFDVQKHSLKGNLAILTSYDQNDRLRDIVLEVDISVAKIISDAGRDVAMILLGDLTKKENVGEIIWKPYIKNKKYDGSDIIVSVLFSGLKKFEDVLESNEIFLLGCPSSLGTIGQIETRRPLLRKGIVAGKNYINKTIILDCPVYFGNSGGLAIQVEEVGFGSRKFSIIGIVTQYIPFIEQLYSIQKGYTNVNMENSGYSIAIPSDVIEEIIRSNQ